MNSCGCSPELFFEIDETAFTFISDVTLRYMNNKKEVQYTVYNLNLYQVSDYTTPAFLKFRSQLCESVLF